MAERLDPNEITNMVEVLLSNVHAQEALVNLLEAKGILRKDEILEEIIRVRDKAARQTTVHS
jgi:transketolase N-terminal domain/subunit